MTVSLAGQAVPGGTRYRNQNGEDAEDNLEQTLTSSSVAVSDHGPCRRRARPDADDLAALPEAARCNIEVYTKSVSTHSTDSKA